MKKLFILLLLVGMGMQAQAQLLLGAHVSRLNNAEEGKWGGGLFIKGLIGDRFAAGVNVKAYPQQFRSSTQVINGQEYNVSVGNVVIPALATFDYRFGETVRPYIGADVGMYNTRTVVRYATAGFDRNESTNKKWYFGAAPKVGLELEVGPVGIFGQAQYNVLFGSGDQKDITVPGINGSIETKPISKFWNFDVGLYFKIGDRGN
jgi:hypothetical protein